MSHTKGKWIHFHPVYYSGNAEMITLDNEKKTIIASYIKPDDASLE